jgi:hypothetical protein
VSEPDNPRQKRKAIWFTAEAAAELEDVQSSLANKLGFKPTPSQTLRHILRKYTQPVDSK